MGAAAAFKYSAAAKAAYEAATNDEDEDEEARRKSEKLSPRSSRAERESQRRAENKQIKGVKASALPPSKRSVRIGRTSFRESADAEPETTEAEETEEKQMGLRVKERVEVTEEELMEREREAITSMYPKEDYEITCYAQLPGARAGTRIYLQEFEKKEILNGLTGVCKDCDIAMNVWTFRLDDDRWMRVLPDVMQPKETDSYRPPAPYKGHIVYGSSTSEALIERDFEKERRAPSKKSSVAPTQKVDNRPKKGPEGAMSLMRAEEAGAERTELHDMFVGGDRKDARAHLAKVIACQAEEAALGTRAEAAHEYGKGSSDDGPSQGKIVVRKITAKGARMSAARIRTLGVLEEEGYDVRASSKQRTGSKGQPEGEESGRRLAMSHHKTV